MAYRILNGYMTLKGQPCDPQYALAQYLENSWRCYLATISITR